MRTGTSPQRYLARATTAADLPEASLLGVQLADTD
jgi:hypothetical protein